MKTNPFAKSSSHFRVLCLLVLGLLGTCGTMGATLYDYSYSVTRFQDLDTGYMVSQICNYYETDEFGDALHTIALPVYAGTDPDTSNPIWLDPGFCIRIMNQPGGGLLIGAPKALPIGAGGGGEGQVFGHGRAKLNKHDGNTFHITAAAPGAQASIDGGKTWFDIHSGDTLPSGCVRFRNGPVSWTGCEVTLEPLTDGQFSSMYGITGGGVNWPNSSVPSFFQDKEWDLVYIGDSDSPFNGSGFGKATIQCDELEFMSVATPEVYIGCIPEPTTVILLTISGSIVWLTRLRQRS